MSYILQLIILQLGRVEHQPETPPACLFRPKAPVSWRFRRMTICLEAQEQALRFYQTLWSWGFGLASRNLYPPIPPTFILTVLVLNFGSRLAGFECQVFRSGTKWCSTVNHASPWVSIYQLALYQDNMLLSRNRWKRLDIQHIVTKLVKTCIFHDISIMSMTTLRHLFLQWLGEMAVDHQLVAQTLKPRPSIHGLRNGDFAVAGGEGFGCTLHEDPWCQTIKPWNLIYKWWVSRKFTTG